MGTHIKQKRRVIQDRSMTKNMGNLDACSRVIQGKWEWEQWKRGRSHIYGDGGE